MCFVTSHIQLLLQYLNGGKFEIRLSLYLKWILCTGEVLIEQPVLSIKQNRDSFINK